MSKRTFSSNFLCVTSVFVFCGVLLICESNALEPKYDKPLGIHLEEFEYPYPVNFMPLTVDGQQVRMAYMDIPPSSEGTGRIVVLLHGKNFYGSYWENTIKALSGSAHRVIVPDQIGFGKSSKPEIPYNFDLLAANTAKLLDHLNIKKAAVVGHSMGGMLAIRFARNYPDRVSHLVLENPIGLEDYRSQIPSQSTDFIFDKEMSATDPERIRKSYERYVVEWKPEVYERFVEVRSRVALSPDYARWAKVSALTYQMIYEQPVIQDFKDIQAPTLLVIGQEDRTVLGRGIFPEETLKGLGNYPELGKKTAAAIPNCQLVELQKIGHIPHLESPGRFHELVLGFIKP